MHWYFCRKYILLWIFILISRAYKPFGKDFPTSSFTCCETAKHPPNKTNKTSNPKDPRLDPPMEGWTNLYDAGVFWGSQNRHWIEGSGYLGKEELHFGTRSRYFPSSTSTPWIPWIFPFRPAGRLTARWSILDTRGGAKDESWEETWKSWARRRLACLGIARRASPPRGFASKILRGIRIQSRRQSFALESLEWSPAYLEETKESKDRRQGTTAI